MRVAGSGRLMIEGIMLRGVGAGSVMCFVLYTYATFSLSKVLLGGKVHIS